VPATQAQHVYPYVCTDQSASLGTEPDCSVSRACTPALPMRMPMLLPPTLPLQLLCYYGFVVPSNPHDVVPLQLEVSYVRIAVLAVGSMAWRYCEQLAACLRACPPNFLARVDSTIGPRLPAKAPIPACSMPCQPNALPA